MGWNEGRTCAVCTGLIQRVDAKLRWVRNGGLRLRQVLRHMVANYVTK